MRQMDVLSEGIRRRIRIARRLLVLKWGTLARRIRDYAIPNQIVSVQAIDLVSYSAIHLWGSRDAGAEALHVAWMAALRATWPTRWLAAIRRGQRLPLLLPGERHDVRTMRAWMRPEVSMESTTRPCARSCSSAES